MGRNTRGKPDRLKLLLDRAVCWDCKTRRPQTGYTGYWLQTGAHVSHLLYMDTIWSNVLTWRLFREFLTQPNNNELQLSSLEVKHAWTRFSAPLKICCSRQKLKKTMNRHMGIICAKTDASEVKQSRITEVSVKTKLGVLQCIYAILYFTLQERKLWHLQTFSPYLHINTWRLAFGWRFQEMWS